MPAGPMYPVARDMDDAVDDDAVDDDAVDDAIGPVELLSLVGCVIDRIFTGGTLGRVFTGGAVGCVVCCVVCFVVCCVVGSTKCEEFLLS